MGVETHSAGHALLLDLDGTLIDSNDQHARSWDQALREEYLDIPLDVLRRMIGMGSDQLLPAAFGIDTDSDIGRRLAKRSGEIFTEQYLSGVQPFGGARELLEAARERWRPLTIVTSGDKSRTEKLLRQAGLSELIDEIITADDARQSKPDPSLVHAALQRTGTAAADALLIGDTGFDAASARRAGVRFLGLKCGGWSEANLRAAGAVEVYADPAELHKNLHQSQLV